MADNNVLAFDASLLAVGAVAVVDGRVVKAATFARDCRGLRGLAKYGQVAERQAAAIAAFLERYPRAYPVIVEVGANADGTTWRAHKMRRDGKEVPLNSRQILMDGMASGLVAGVATVLGFGRVEFVAAGAGGWGGKKNAFLARALPGVEPEDEHQRDAAAMAAWWMARNGALEVSKI